MNDWILDAHTHQINDVVVLVLCVRALVQTNTENAINDMDFSWNIFIYRILMMFSVSYRILQNNNRVIFLTFDFFIPQSRFRQTFFFSFLLEKWNACWICVYMCFADIYLFIYFLWANLRSISTTMTLFYWLFCWSLVARF